MTSEARTSEYHYRNWWPKFRPVDFIPVVGIVTVLARRRRETNLSTLSIRDHLKAYFEGRNMKNPIEILGEILSPGTHNWPEPASRAAYWRAQLMAARNGAFMAYHSGIMLYAISQIH